MRRVAGARRHKRPFFSNTSTIPSELSTYNSLCTTKPPMSIVGNEVAFKEFLREVSATIERSYLSTSGLK